MHLIKCDARNDPEKVHTIQATSPFYVNTFWK